MDYEPLSVVTADGHEYSVETFGDPDSDAVVIVLPAMAVTATHYRPVIDQLLAAGLAAAIADFRGHGQSNLRAGRRVDWGYKELIEIDLPATLAAVHSRFPAKPVYALGHSLGGQVATLHAAAYPGELAGIALIASCSVYYRGWGFPMNGAVLVFTQVVALISQLLGYFPGDKLHFAGAEGRRQMIDWAGNGRHGQWRIANSSKDYESLLGRVAIPVLAMSLDGDGFAPAAAVDNLVAKMPYAEISRHHWASPDMPPAGLDHVGWVRHCAPIIEKLRTWIA